MKGKFQSERKRRKKLLSRLLTSNFKRIPLINITFSYDHYQKCGKEKSCRVTLHPTLAGDEVLKQMLETVVDYIRDNYDMNEIV